MGTPGGFRPASGVDLVVRPERPYGRQVAEGEGSDRAASPAGSVRGGNPAEGQTDLIGTTGRGVRSSAAMAQDASDGVMNGMMGSTAISMGGMGGGMMGGGMMPATAGTSGLATAMTAFAGSGMNRTGLTASDLQALIDELAASSGTIQ